MPAVTDELKIYNDLNVLSGVWRGVNQDDARMCQKGTFIEHMCSEFLIFADGGYHRTSTI